MHVLILMKFVASLMYHPDSSSFGGTFLLIEVLFE